MSTSKLKISIAALSLCVSAVAIYIHLPYVIAAVPLAIFAVSAVVALISATYLIKLAGSRADRKESGHTASQEPQKFVCESCTNLENRSSMPTPTPPPVTFGTQSSPPLPPPPPPHCFTASKHTEQPKNGAPKKAGEPENDNDRSALLKQIREGTRLKATNDNTTKKNTPHTKKFIPPGGQLHVNPDDVIQMRGKLKKPVQPNNNPIALAMLDKFNTMNFHVYSEDECSSNDEGKWGSSEHSNSNSSCANEGKQEKKKLTKRKEKSTSSTLQSDNKKRRESLDSGHGSDDNVKSKPTSPLHSVPKAKLPIPPKPVNSKTKPEAPPATTVTEVKDSPTSLVKGLTEMFNNLGG